ncbi:MAG: plasmid stabilization protein [Flaviaesturariibacter sp.]|nr:plasmid stabilization protein [Flaviaesturariibacter sp.]
MAERTIIWTKTALRQFQASIEYIRADSEQSATEVKEKLLSAIEQLRVDAAIHRKDPYKSDNDGSFLYFELLRHRIVYHLIGDQVFIIRIRHTSREPRSY